METRQGTRRRFRGRLRGLPFALLLIALLLPGLAGVARAETVRVFAAASTVDAITDLARAYEAKTGERIVTVFAASSLLVRQIEAGAPADIFVSANRTWIDYLEARSLIDGAGLRVVAGNALVLIAPAEGGEAFDIRPGFDLSGRLGDGRLALADPAHVPVGMYARQALRYLGVWPAVADRIAIAGNARAALALVERGEAPYGIVYASDAAASRRVRVVGVFPDGSHDPIAYWAAPVGGGRAADGAARFVGYLESAEAAAVFDRLGFRRFERVSARSRTAP